MKEIKKELVGGAIETRFYDENDRLVDIRKWYPPGRVKNVNPFTSSTSSGHDY